MEDLDLYSKKRALDLNLIISLIPKEERILFISEKISNKRVAILVRSIPFVLVYLFYIFIYLLLMNESFLFWISKPIFYIIMDLVVFIIFSLIAYFFGKKNLNFRKDFYLIFTDKYFNILLFAARSRSPIITKHRLDKEMYYILEKRTFGKSFNLTFYEIETEIKKYKFRRISNYTTLQKMLDSIFFHFGQNLDQRLLNLRYNLPLSLKISLDEYNKIKKRRINIYRYFGISTTIVLILGLIFFVVFSNTVLWLIVLIVFSLIALCVVGVLDVIYLMVLLELRRCSSLDEQVIIKNEEIEYNNIKIPFHEHLAISASYISSRNTTQTPQNPKNSIYALTIYDKVASEKKRYFGPIDDFQNRFKFIYFHFMKWKNENGQILTKERLYENEIKR